MLFREGTCRNGSRATTRRRYRSQRGSWPCGQAAAQGGGERSRFAERREPRARGIRGVRQGRARLSSTAALAPRRQPTANRRRGGSAPTVVASFVAGFLAVGFVAVGFAI